MGNPEVIVNSAIKYIKEFKPKQKVRAVVIPGATFETAYVEGSAVRTIILSRWEKSVQINPVVPLP